MASKCNLTLKNARTPLTLNSNYSRRPRVGQQARTLKTQCSGDLHKQPSLVWSHSMGRPHCTQWAHHSLYLYIPPTKYQHPKQWTPWLQLHCSGTLAMLIVILLWCRTIWCQCSKFLLLPTILQYLAIRLPSYHGADDLLGHNEDQHGVHQLEGGRHLQLSYLLSVYCYVYFRHCINLQMALPIISCFETCWSSQNWSVSK